MGGFDSDYGSGGDVSSSPWLYQQPYLLDVFNRSAGLANVPTQYFPGDTVADLQPEQTAALGGITNRAMQGSPLVSAAQEQNLKTTSGYYLDPNQNTQLQGLVDLALESVYPDARSAGEAAGRTGSYADTATRNDAIARAAGQVYGTERGYQESATGQAGALADYDYSDLERLYNVGQTKQSQTQSETDAAKEKFDFYQNEPWTRLSNYRNMVTGGYGGLTSSSASGTK